MLRALYDLPAPAKLNLFLHVVGRRADGYHLLQSAFVLIDWADTLHFECRADGRLVRHDLGPALPADDLSLRAARALQAASATSLGADISVLKRVPWGAGMGGGSSDAATVLLALNRLWNLNWPRERLLELALPLGADVPFFVGGDNAWVEGIGEKLTPIDLLPQHYAVVKPEAGVDTARLFCHPGLARDSEPDTLESFVAEHKISGLKHSKHRKNDLQAVAQQLAPSITEVARWLEQRFGNSRMTGSGSAVFSVLDSAKIENMILWADGDLPPGWVGRRCRGLDHHPLKGWAD